jgi:hypothetical protein
MPDGDSAQQHLERERIGRRHGNPWSHVPSNSAQLQHETITSPAFNSISGGRAEDEACRRAPRFSVTCDEIATADPAEPIGWRTEPGGLPSSRAPCVKAALSRCQGVKANFHRVALETSRPVAPRIAFQRQEGPAKCKPDKVTPAMAAGVTSRLWEMGDVVDMLKAFEARDHTWTAAA